MGNAYWLFELPSSSLPNASCEETGSSGYNIGLFSVVLLLGTGAPSMGRALLEMRGEVGRGTWREAGREEGGQRTLEPAGQQGDAEHPPSPQVRTYLCATAHGPRCQGHPPDSFSTCGLQTLAFLSRQLLILLAHGYDHDWVCGRACACDSVFIPLPLNSGF